MTKLSLFPAALLFLGIGPASVLLHADTIFVKGTTATGSGPDDLNTVTTMDLEGIATSRIIAQALDSMTFTTKYNFVFAGLGAAEDIKSIDPGDLTINQYTPWVVNNYATQPAGANPGKNYVVGPDGQNYSKQIRFQDAGGVDFVFLYKPQFSDEPRNINFIQAYTESVNGGPLTPPAIDSPSETDTAYYNDGALAGTGTTLLSGREEFLQRAEIAAHLAQKGRCELFEGGRGI